MRLILDVGCGGRPTGNVNVDLFPKPRAKHIENFVKADACHLPFRDKCFCKVQTFHVIEHVKEPFCFLKEIKRVCKGIIFLKCPHRMSLGAKRKNHIHSFDCGWFRKAFQALGLYCADVHIDFNYGFCQIVAVAW
jgi:ubiquinone/menaquinone biosynthesis C-methylase UbiE